MKYVKFISKLSAIGLILCLVINQYIWNRSVENIFDSINYSITKSLIIEKDLYQYTIYLSSRIDEISSELLLSDKENIDKLKDINFKISKINTELLGTNVKRIINGSVFVKGLEGLGAGTIIKKTDTSMYILTAYHVIRFNAELKELDIPMAVSICYMKNNEKNEFSGMTVYAADIIKYDKEKDLALLKTEVIDINLETIHLAEKEPEKGDTVFSVGNPLSLYRTVSKGILSNKIGTKYVTDNTITFGNSGGGLYNKKGELIGVPVQVIGYHSGHDFDDDNKPLSVPESSLGFSVNLSTIKEFLKGMDCE